MRFEYNHNESDLRKAAGFEDNNEFVKAATKASSKILQFILTGKLPEYTQEELRALCILLLTKAFKEERIGIADNLYGLVSIFMHSLLTTAFPGKIDSLPRRGSELVEVLEMIEPDIITTTAAAAMIAGSTDAIDEGDYKIQGEGNYEIQG